MKTGEKLDLDTSSPWPWPWPWDPSPWPWPWDPSPWPWPWPCGLSPWPCGLEAQKVLVNITANNAISAHMQRKIAKTAVNALQSCKYSISTSTNNRGC